MKHKLLFIVFLACFYGAEARHITGGEMIYDYIGPGSLAGTKRFKITLLLFRDENCSGGCAQMPTTVAIAIYDGYVRVGDYHYVNQSSIQSVPINPLPPCITNPPDLSYTVGSYSFTVDLPDNLGGYTAVYQTCCRISSIENIADMTGATYICNIPGVLSHPAGFIDNSPRFKGAISVVCYNKPFTLDFSATDPDGDSLVYNFCDAYNGGNAGDASYNTPGPPPYGSATYINAYAGYLPLGNLASIDPATGIISGVAPDAGKYVVSVCISSYRNGVYIAEHRKDFIITVAPCDLTGAQLQPRYLTCDGFTFTFQNLNNSPLNQTFLWTFGDPASGASNSSTSATPSHTFTTAGDYIIKLYINLGGGCSDSATSILGAYPGYFPGIIGPNSRCINEPVQFDDGTIANYGHNNHWHWDFGVPGTNADTSNIKNPVYTFTTAGTYTVTLNVQSTKGCTGSKQDTIQIVNNAPMEVTNDTLICSIDNLQLDANTFGTAGTFTWSPNYNINNIHSPTPIVHPTVTTTYTIAFQDNYGCAATDQVKVKVVDFVTLQAAPHDTTICLTDSMRLRLTTDGLHFTWTPPATLNDPTIVNPVATPVDPVTNYHIKATIGGCSTEDNIKVTTVPYPAKQPSDTLNICLAGSAVLHASGGSIYSWSPPIFLNDPNIPDPTSLQPTSGVRYIATVKDVLGCPKPVYDTVILHVIKINANAGPRDTAVVIDQPLQLSATGGDIYVWTPSIWLNDPDISDPIALPKDDTQYVVRVTDLNGCFGLDTIKIRVYKVLPDLFIPDAFSPNGDGTNDIFRPLALGLRSVDAFRIYNRWGQLVFSTSEIGKGWDGSFGGRPQDPGTYVWYAEGTDYKNVKLYRKGYVVLIR